MECDPPADYYDAYVRNEHNLYRLNKFIAGYLADTGRQPLYIDAVSPSLSLSVSAWLCVLARVGVACGTLAMAPLALRVGTKGQGAKRGEPRASLHGGGTMRAQGSCSKPHLRLVQQSAPKARGAKRT